MINHPWPLLKAPTLGTTGLDICSWLQYLSVFIDTCVTCFSLTQYMQEKKDRQVDSYPLYTTITLSKECV